MRSSARPRFLGPVASAFHSAASKSSIDTKVGSPPMVRRTSLAFSSRIDLVAERVERLPAFLGERVGDARALRNPVDRHLELEFDLGEADAAGDRRGRAVVRRRGQRDVALAGDQARGRIEPDPAGAGQIDLGPGVEIGEVGVVPVGPSRAYLIGLQLDQIAGDEAGGEAELAHDLDQQPGGVAAGARAVLQGSVRRLNARLHAGPDSDLLLRASG